MIDGCGRNDAGPPTGSIPPDAAPDAAHRPSRHDHFPRSDSARRHMMEARAAGLDRDLRAIDAGPDGIARRLAALADAGPDADPAAILTAGETLLADDNWVRDRLAALASLSHADPFAMPPVRAFNGGVLGGLVLADPPPFTLSVLIRPFNSPPPRDASVIFSPGHGLTRIVKSGGARIRRYRTALTKAEHDGGFRAATAAPCALLGEEPLADGMWLRTDQQCESFNLVGGNGDIVMLQLFVHAASRVPMREYDPATGRLIRVATAARATSFRQMGLGLLRAFDRRDAAPLFAAALDDEDFAMRWAVMREFLALDAAAAHPHLAAMAARDPHPEVRAAAAQTLGLLRERGLPVPAREAAPCPM